MTLFMEPMVLMIIPKWCPWIVLVLMSGSVSIRLTRAWPNGLCESIRLTLLMLGHLKFLLLVTVSMCPFLVLARNLLLEPSSPRVPYRCGPRDVATTTLLLVCPATMVTLAFGAA